MRLEGKVAVVTGGGRGIGKSICHACASEGALVAVVDIEKSAAQLCAEEIASMNKKAASFCCDITRTGEVEKLVQDITAELGTVDIIVNNAGIVGKRSFIFQSDEDIWRRTIEVNLFGTYYCIREFLPVLIEKRKGRLINIASISGKQASPTNSAYAASKHAVIGITRTVAAEVCLLGLNEITVNAICPGVTDTEMITGKGMVLDELARLLNTSREEVIETKIKTLNNQKRMLDPEEISSMAVYLASDESSGITGQAINVCGGSVFY